MKSLTVEDVLYCHERNSNVYLASPFEKQVVFPCSIGENTIEKQTEYFTVLTRNGGKTCLAKHKVPKTVDANLRRRHYIPMGEECAICYEGIFHKRNAQLTDCGHAFHFSCIQQTVLSAKTAELGCPLCREPIYTIDKNRYSSYSTNFLDILEDFWMNLSTRIPEMCFSNKTHQKLHITGTHATQCNICCIYCKTDVKTK